MDAVVAARSQAIDLAAERPFRVGTATVDPVSHEAKFNDDVERLQPQNLKVLIALVHGAGRVVTREQLIDRCWDGRFVGDDVINRAISTLRQFAEHAGGFAIETVPRSGYRLIEISTSRVHWPWMIAAVALVLLVLAAAAYLEWSRRNAVRPTPTIAILPFTAASVDAQERELASDARDAIAHTLSQTQYGIGLTDGLPQGGRAASDFVVSGNVSGRSEKMVVTVRVEDTMHNAIVYSHRFETDRAKAGDLPDQIGAQIAGSLGWKASLLMLDRSYPSDPAITAELFSQFVDYQTARQVAVKAPDSVIAQVTLGFSAQDALPDLPLDQRAEVAQVGRQALDRIRVLAPGYSGADILWCWLHSHARMIECEDHLRAGMRSDPNAPWVDNFLANQLKDVGRTNEALQLAMTSLGHDPYAPGKIGLDLRMLEAVGRHDEADDLYRDAQKGWPDEPVIFADRVYGMMDRGDFDALLRFRKELGASRASPLDPVEPRLAAIKANNVARERELCPIQLAPSFTADLCMLAFIRLGDNDDAFAFAWRIYPNRIGRTPAEEDKLWLESGRYFDVDILMGPAAAPLRRDPRFLELARRLGVLTYWRSGRLPDFCQPPKAEPVCSKLIR